MNRRSPFLGILSLVFFVGLGGACAAGSNDSGGFGPGDDTGIGGDGTSGDTGAGFDTGTTKPDTGTGDASKDGSGTDGTTDGSGDVTIDGGGDVIGGDACASGCPTDYWDLDGNPLTGVCGCEYHCHKLGAADPVDPAYTDDNCDGSDAIVEKCVFVSSSTGIDDPTGGHRDKPVKTIAFAISRAKAVSGYVCINGETYNEFVSMESGVDVYGGFNEADPDFKFRRGPLATTNIVNAGTVVFEAKADVDTYLEGLKLTATAPTGIGASAYAVRYGGGSGTFYVRWNTITVAGGTSGADGTAGASGTDAPATSPAGHAYNDMSGAGATPISSSCSATGGAGGAGGYGSSSGGDGSPGTTGSGGPGGGSGSCTSSASGGTVGGSVLTAGANGAPGGSSVGVGTLDTAGVYVPPTAPNGTDGSAGGSGGGGGGGGGRTGGFLICSTLRGGGGGAGGNGGCGGKAGTGGVGGGGSLGVTAAGGTLIVDGCDITVSKGGTGGNGQPGGGAGKGGAGGAGGSGEGGTVASAGSGGPGGSGSAGGLGGPGAGGVGGPSTCVASSSGTTVTFVVGLSHNSCVNGGGGPGGIGGSNGGMTGATGPTGASGAQLSL